ncbi:MAG: hypothetical protein NC342_06170 [Pseudoflavonifractor sp.]|nr:hypothetical protein [Alloprevotella sp.]MCM1117103.1 hypothetical protein [Pseudoflavonifractor sp.]
MKQTLLIADCGATSGKWACIDHTSGSVVRFRTGPVNSSLHTRERIAAELARAKTQCPVPPSALQVYAAGALGEQKEELRGLLTEAFGIDRANITVESDLYGAALGLLGHERGITCILGTGSNSCLWDGKEIKRNVPPMGYILGDEGSGSAIGAALLRAAIRRAMPSELIERWQQTYPEVDYKTVVEEVYRHHGGSAYIASFVPFASANIPHPFISTLVEGQIDSFFSNVIALYPEAKTLPVAFTGGVAMAFEPQLRKVAAAWSVRVGLVAADPLDLLIERAL